VTRKRASLTSPSSDDTSVGLAAEWQALFCSAAPERLGHLLERAVAWKRQVNEHGDVARSIREDLRLIARDVLDARGDGTGTPQSDRTEPVQHVSDHHVQSPGKTRIPVAPRARRTRAPVQALPPASSALVPGTRLVKQHGGRTHVAEITADGVLYEGQTYSSLSAVAKAITGTHWNGLLFFGLRRRKVYPATKAGRA
jgi:hypothetical protein